MPRPTTRVGSPETTWWKESTDLQGHSLTSACTSLSLPSTRKRKKVCSDSLLTKLSPSLETLGADLFLLGMAPVAVSACWARQSPLTQTTRGCGFAASLSFTAMPRIHPISHHVPECLLVFAACWNWAFSAQWNHLHPSINNFTISKIWLFFIVLFFFMNPYHNTKSYYFHLVGIQERMELNYVSSQYRFTWTSLFYLQRNNAVKILLGSSPILDWLT